MQLRQNIVQHFSNTKKGGMKNYDAASLYNSFCPWYLKAHGLKEMKRRSGMYQNDVACIE